LFVAIGSTELSDKMASHLTDLNVFDVKNSLSSGASFAAG
jgi:hypothetical protein